MIKESLIAHQQHLIETRETLNFINCIFEVSESFSVDKIEDVKGAFFEWFLSQVEKYKVDIFYVGERVIFDEFLSRVKINQSHVKNIAFYPFSQLNNELDIVCEVKRARLPIVVYDAKGSGLFQKVDADFSPLGYSHYTGQPIVQSWVDFSIYFKYQYDRLYFGSYETVIIGSSYSYFMMTDIDSSHSINFSIPGLDFSSALMLIEKIKETGRVRKILLCFNFYDIYKEISKGRHEIYTRAYNAMSDFLLSLDKSKDDLLSERVLIYRTLFEEDRDSLVKALILDHKKQVSKVQSEQVGYKNYCLSEIMKETSILNSMSNIEIDNDAKRIAGLHNENMKYPASLEHNRKTIEKIQSISIEEDIITHLIIPPLPKAYMECIHEDIVDNARMIFESVACEFFKVHDFSDDVQFSYSDFIDGQHTNKNGGHKLMAKLFKMGIISSPVL